MTPILIAALLLVLAILLRRVLKPNSLRSIVKSKSSQKPSEIISLRVYPIKSCRGFETKVAKQCMTGLDLDRRWMLVDEKTHVFLTIRQIPEMTLINTALSEDGESLVLSVTPASSEKSETISIPAHPSPAWLAEHTNLASDIKIWDTITDGYVYGESVGINQLFSKFLNRPVVLVYKGPTPRVLKGNGDPRLLGRVQNTNFPDVLPVLVASQASIDELNERLKAQGHEEITIERFRPNIIIRGHKGDAWVEDSWKTVRIGSSSTAHAGPGGEKSADGAGLGEEDCLTYDIVARCGRCQVPNVDPETAQKHKTQPWDTMMSYRRVDEGLKYKPCFGMLGVPRSEGEIRVGMKFEVLEETSEHFYIKGF
ncbi:MOSC domain-containing protein [Aspergillus foveolatus]|uniref:MOSC domain-containing protein n=1 Tax=Aspergillus foveolatus TaxID=210207 RepID=UPI003CCCFA45